MALTPSLEDLPDDIFSVIFPLVTSPLSRFSLLFVSQRIRRLLLLAPAPNSSTTPSSPSAPSLAYLAFSADGPSPPTPTSSSSDPFLLFRGCSFALRCAEEDALSILQWGRSSAFPCPWDNDVWSTAIAKVLLSLFLSSSLECLFASFTFSFLQANAPLVRFLWENHCPCSPPHLIHISGIRDRATLEFLRTILPEEVKSSHSHHSSSRDTDVSVRVHGSQLRPVLRARSPQRFHDPPGRRSLAEDSCVKQSARH